MKKYLIILLTLPLVATSCLKDDEDLFDKSASERMQEYLDNASKVLSSAANGWVVEYYPSATQEYGGIRMYLKFDATKNMVTVASEAGGAEATEKSYYSFGEDYGPTLNFDTENKLLHYYSKPIGTVGEANIGWGGDYEFIIMSAEADKVVLCGKKTKNTIILTPAAAADWTSDFQAWLSAVDKMDEMLSYQLEVGGRVYQMSRDAVKNYNSRHFTINTTPATTVGFIYTPTGIKFYEPLTVDNVSISEMTWNNGEFVDERSGCKITQIRTNDTFNVTAGNIKVRYADISVSPSNSNSYYVIGAYPASDAQTKSEARICQEILSKIASTDDLYSGNARNVTFRLDAETQYIACAFAVTIINDFIYPTSKLSKSEPFTTLPNVAMKAEYEAWLGKWDLKSTSSEKNGKPVTLDLVIDEYDRNETYEVYGWDIGLLRNEMPQRLALSGKKAVIPGDRIVLGKDGEHVVTWCSLSAVSGIEGIPDGQTILVGGLDEPFTLTLNADGKSAKVTQYSGGLDGGGSFTVQSINMFAVLDGTYFYVNAAPGYTTGDFPLGPYTMVKTGDLDPKQSAVAVRKSQAYPTYVVNMKAYTNVKNFTAR